jgi:hypothetical protein
VLVLGIGATALAAGAVPSTAGRLGDAAAAEAVVSVDPSVAAGPVDAVAAVELVTYPWRSRLPGWTIEFLPPRPGYEGMTYPRRRLIEVYVRPGASARQVAEIAAHELGHAVDVSRLTDADRARWRAARGLPDTTAWNPTSAAPDFASGAGDFAEAFAAWQVGKSSRSTLAGQPDAQQLALVAELAR